MLWCLLSVWWRVSLVSVSRLKFEDPCAGVNILIINSHFFDLLVENQVIHMIKLQDDKNMKNEKETCVI